MFSKIIYLVTFYIQYDFLKLNLPESITVEQVTEEIRVFQEELGHYLYEYEGLVKKLENVCKSTE